MAVAVRERLRRFGVPFTQAGESVGVAVASPRTPHRTAEPTVRDFQLFSVLEFMGSDFQFGVGVRGRNCTKYRFYGIFTEVVHRSCQQKGVVTLGK